MRNIIFSLAVGLSALVITGCAGPERKLGRGISNTCEIVRWGELRSSIEENAVFRKPGYGSYGAVHGFDRSLQRIGLGLYEVVTFPIPSYKPIFTKTLSPSPGLPESYKPTRIDDPLFNTDTYTGFSGGDVLPIVPGSRFQIFEN